MDGDEKERDDILREQVKPLGKEGVSCILHVHVGFLLSF